MQQSWKRKQRVLFCLLSAEGLVSQPSVLCFRLKVSGENAQYRWPTSQTAFNGPYSRFVDKGEGLREGHRYDKREGMLIFKGAEQQRSQNSEQRVLFLTVCLYLCIYVNLYKYTQACFWQGVCVSVSELSPACCVTLTEENQHEIPQSCFADLSLA